MLRKPFWSMVLSLDPWLMMCSLDVYINFWYGTYDWYQSSLLTAQVIILQMSFSGPSFGYLYSDKIITRWRTGQLQHHQLTTSTQREELEDLYVQQMLSRHGSHLATIALEKEIDINKIQKVLFGWWVCGNQISLSNRLNQVAQLFAQDQAKVISIVYHGVGGLGWDTYGYSYATLAFGWIVFQFGFIYGYTISNNAIWKSLAWWGNDCCI